MDHLLGDAKRLVQRLTNHDNSVDILISEATNLQNKLIAMRQYKDEVGKLNDIAEHRPRSTLILGSQLENQRIQNLEVENRELSISLAEHQSALELIMNKYREQVLLMMEHKPFKVDVTKNKDETIEMVYMKERIAEMAHVMLKSAAIDDNAQIQEIEFIRRLQVENENLRELLEISGGKLPSDSHYLEQVCSVNPNIKNDFHDNVILPLESYVLPKTESPIKTESESLTTSVHNNNVEDFTIDDSTDEELFNSLPLKKRYGSKKGRLPLPFDIVGEENTSMNTNIKNKEHIQRLEQLFKDPNASLKDSSVLGHSLAPGVTDSASKPNPENYYLSMDPSENCFRAIISDIKPLDFNIDMNEKLNEKLFDLENVTASQQSDKSNPFFTDIASASAKSANSEELTGISESSVLEFLDYIIDAPSEEEEMLEASHMFTSKTKKGKHEDNGMEISRKNRLDNLFSGNCTTRESLCIDDNDNTVHGGNVESLGIGNDDGNILHLFTENNKVSIIPVENKVGGLFTDNKKECITSLENKVGNLFIDNEKEGITSDVDTLPDMCTDTMDKNQKILGIDDAHVLVTYENIEDSLISDDKEEPTLHVSDDKEEATLHENEGSCLFTKNDEVVVTDEDKVNNLLTDGNLEELKFLENQEGDSCSYINQKTDTKFKNRDDDLLPDDNQKTDKLGENDVADAMSVGSDIHNPPANQEIETHFKVALEDSNIMDEIYKLDELDALDFLDDMLDFESNFDDDNESEIDDDTINESEIDNDTINESEIDNDTINESVIDNDTINKTVIDNSNINETIIDNDNINETVIDNDNINETVIDNDNINEQTTISSSCDNIGIDSSSSLNNPINNDHNKIDIKIKSSVDSDDKEQKQKLMQLSSDCRTSNTAFNGEISDNDSETTYTEEDIDQTLSDFDSIFDSNDYDDDEDDDENFE